MKLPVLVFLAATVAYAQTQRPGIQATVQLVPGAVNIDKAPPSPALSKNGADLLRIIAENLKAAPDKEASARIQFGDGYRVAFVHREVPGIAMAHSTGPAKGTEVHYIVEGAATVVTGGTINLPPTAAGKPPSTTVIEGGVIHHLTKGDVLVVPAGTPHWYKEIVSPVTYREVRFDTEKK